MRVGFRKPTPLTARAAAGDRVGWQVWTKFDQSLASATSVAEVASQLMYLHANTRVLLPSWARSQRPRWLADMQRLQEEVSKPAIDDEGPILRPGRRLKGLIQGLEGGMDWELVEQLWEVRDHSLSPKSSQFPALSHCLMRGADSPAGARTCHSRHGAYPPAHRCVGATARRRMWAA